MKQEKTPIVESQNLSNSKIETLQSKKALKELILFRTEDKLNDKYSDYFLDRENEKIKLIGGAEISIRQVKNFIQSKARLNLPCMFTVDGYYKPLCKLFGFSESEAEIYFKRKEFADFTNEVIYGCFDKGVLLSLHSLNPYTGYISRTYKHYQFLTDKGIEVLSRIIDEAINVANGCDSYYEFRKKWHELHKVPYNKSMFEGTIFA